MKYDPQLYRDCFINDEIRIPSLTNQDFMESRRFFFGGSNDNSQPKRDSVPSVCLFFFGFQASKNRNFLEMK